MTNPTNAPFSTGFDRYALPGDAITGAADGFRLVATLQTDHDAGKPDQNDDGFWPSLDPKSAGFIGAKSRRTLARHMAKAREVMAAWERDDWFYVGVIVTASRNGVKLGEASLWGVDCNYPGPRGNAYLLEVANEIAGEAISEARSKLATLCECAEAA